jgi:hypothetical protein
MGGEGRSPHSRRGQHDREQVNGTSERLVRRCFVEQKLLNRFSKRENEAEMNPVLSITTTKLLGYARL